MVVETAAGGDDGVTRKSFASVLVAFSNGFTVRMTAAVPPAVMAPDSFVGGCSCLVLFAAFLRGRKPALPCREGGLKEDSAHERFLHLHPSFSNTVQEV